MSSKVNLGGIRPLFQSKLGHLLESGAFIRRNYGRSCSKQMLLLVNNRKYILLSGAQKNHFMPALQKLFTFIQQKC